MDIRSRYSDRVRVPISFADPSRTKQDFLKESDVNWIIARYEKTGFLVDPLAPGSALRPAFGDFTNVPDYHESATFIAQAQEAFMALPASLRKRFNNSPADLLDFINDESNRDEAVKLGLIAAPVPEEVSQVAQTSVPASAAET